MTFHRKPYLWILTKIGNFQCSDRLPRISTQTDIILIATGHSEYRLSFQAMRE